MASSKEVSIYVPQLLPGETADVQIEHRSPHTGIGYGHVLRRWQDSSERTKPLCASYGFCGGCTLQHLRYEQQLVFKKRWVEQAFLEELGVVPHVHPVVAAPRGGVEGRRHAKWVLASSYQGVTLGSYAPRSHQVVSMQGCALVRPQLRRLAMQVESLLQNPPPHLVYEESAQHGSVRYVLARENAQGSQLQLLWVVKDEQHLSYLQSISQALAQAFPSLVSVGWQRNASSGNALLSRDSVSFFWGPSVLEEQIGPLTLQCSPLSFVQAHAEMATQLYHDVAHGFAPRAQERILDLYAGLGGIGLTTLHQTPSGTLVGIEENPHAVADAHANLGRNGFTQEQARFVCGDAASLGSWESLKDKRSFDLISLNPPRKGCAPEVLAFLLSLQPRKLAYVSCNPRTLARDAQRLQRHYRLQEVQPYDFHPHTPHVECLAWFTPVAELSPF